MSDFSKTFLRERINGAERAGESFGIFGKHPGWDDHIEDLPLPTESMVVAKQLLYVQGIGSQISSGAWTQLAAEARLADFNHAFLWVRGSQFLAGRMWGSSDGKRRTHFPMVAVFQATDDFADTAVDAMLSRLEKVSAGCRATRSAAQVRKVIAEISGGDPAAPIDTKEEDRLFLGVTPGSVQKLARDLRGNLPPRCRLGADAADYRRSLRFWSRVYSFLAPADMPLLFIAPLGAPWVDVLAREPAPGHFFCLRAGLPALPMTYPPGHNETIEELDAEEFVKAAQGKKAGPGRSWISRMFGH